MDKSIFVGQREVNDSVLLVAARSSWNVCPAPREEEKKLAASWTRKIDNLCQAGQRNQPSYIALPSKASLSTTYYDRVHKKTYIWLQDSREGRPNIFWLVVAASIYSTVNTSVVNMLILTFE